MPSHHILGVDIAIGMNPGEEKDVAALYAAAFARKFRPAFGDAATAAAIMAPTLHHDRVIVARDGATIAGVAGFNLDGRGLVAPSLTNMARHRGWARALFGMACLAFLDSDKQDNVLVMDGITVSDAFRGRGIGTKLLNAIVGLAANSGKTAVQLSVIDTNPHARRLYERFGFTPIKTENLGGLGRRLFGFTSATTMQRPV